jgi:hypothetical protein
MTMGEMTQRLHDQGKDSTGLGHRVWKLFRGKDGAHTRIYTAYQPFQSRAQGYSTIYMQQQTNFCNQPRDPNVPSREPRLAFIEDLELEVAAQQMARECMIIIMDANGDVTSGPLKVMEMRLGLNNTILSKLDHCFPPT